MAKKLIKKQTGGPSHKGKVVTKSYDGNYRTVDKSKYNANTEKEVSRTRRTLKGAMKGAEKVNLRSGPPRSNSEEIISDEKYMKKGGTFKKRKNG